jgi:bifunctional UDP-N-acetylglucosamine pyrophosphorylase/glucosamine-1-phosphate N-acetyltransferase
MMSTKSKDGANVSVKESLKVAAIILAAGKGTRMASPLPKVLHPVAGIPMIHKVIHACLGSGAEDIRLVVGYQSHLVKNVANILPVNCYEQVQPVGTADAVRSAQIENLDGLVLIVNGDHPLIQAEDLKKVLREFQEAKTDIAVVTAEVRDPGSLGRIIRHHGELMAIVEAKDASRDTLKIREVNSGLYVVRADVLQDLLPQIKNNNVQREYYLTDIITLGKEQGFKVKAIQASPLVAFGVNNQQELAQANRVIFRRKAKKLMESGVVIIDPRNTYIEEEVEIGPGSVIYPGAYVRGKTKIGAFCVLEPHTFVNDCLLGDSVEVRAGCYLEKSKLHNKVSVGPYARLRPETELGEEAHIGNFVELKKVKFGKRSKAGHLSYLGDADVGEDVNVGCGTITCNYAVDRKKYKTKIGDKVFVGSDVQFVAPVEIGNGAIIASGSTITEDVPAKALALARSRQVNKEKYADKFIDPEQEEV